MFKKTILKFAIIFISIGFLNSSFANEKIIWPYVCYKPIYICENGKLIDGIGYNILKLIWSNMPEYEHKLMLTPIKRILEFAKQKEHQIMYGLYKTSEREKFLYFSIPCRISTPTYIVFRKKDVDKFGRKKVSLENLLLKTKFKFLLLNSISFGKGIDELITKYRKLPNIYIEYNTTDMGYKSLKLLLNNKIDYFLSLDGTSYDAKELGALNKISYLPIHEQSNYEVGYITAPKSEWGKLMIMKVNKILKKEIQKKEFFNFYTKLVSKEMIPELKKQYKKKIVIPALNHKGY